MRFITKKISQKWIGVTYFKEQFLLFSYGKPLHNFTNMFWAQVEPSRKQANHSFLDIETRLKIKNLLGDGGQSFCMTTEPLVPHAAQASSNAFLDSESILNLIISCFIMPPPLLCGYIIAKNQASVK